MHDGNKPRLTDLKREAILQAAIEEFRDNSFESTSMDRIAERAGVSKRTVYNHFDNKEALFQGIMLELWKCAMRPFDQDFQSDQPLDQQLRQFLAHKAAMLDDDNLLNLAKVAIAATIHSPERTAAMVGRLEVLDTGLIDWIKAAQAARKIDSVDPVMLGQILQGMIKNFAFWPQVAMGRPRLTAEMQAKVVDMVVHMFMTTYALPPTV